MDKKLEVSRPIAYAEKICNYDMPPRDSFQCPQLLLTFSFSPIFLIEDLVAPQTKHRTYLLVNNIPNNLDYSTE